MILAWPLLLAASMMGWGLIAAAAARRWCGLELRTAADALPIGVGVILAIAGFAVAVDLHTSGFVTLVVVIGLVVVAATVVARVRAAGRVPWRAGDIAVAAGLIGVVLTIAVWRAGQIYWNPCDDDVAYLYLARRITDMGNLLDPMNNRRVTSLGGMSSLQAMFLDRLPDATLPLTDLFLGPLLILVQLWKTSKGRWSIWGIASAIAASLVVANLINTSPVLLPAALALAVFRFGMLMRIRSEQGTGGPRRNAGRASSSTGDDPTADVTADVTAAGPIPTADRGGTTIEIATTAAAPARAADPSRSQFVLGAAIGLLTAAAGALRPQFALALAPFAFGVAVLPPVSRATATRLVGVAAGGAVGLGGWAVASWRAVATPLFPLLSGNADPTWPANGPDTPGPFLVDVLRDVASATRTPQSALAIAIGALVLVGLHRLGTTGGAGRTLARWAGRTYALAVVCTLLLMAILSTMWWNIAPLAFFPRFWVPLVLATVLVPVAALNEAPMTFERSTMLRLAAFAAVAILLVTGGPRRVDDGVGDADPSLSRSMAILEADRYEDQRGDYDAVAAMIEPGSKVLAAVDVPSLLLDHGFDVNTLDFVGSTSPTPRLPYFEGAEAKVDWAREQGYDYIVAVDPSQSSCLYSAAGQDESLASGSLYASWVPWFRDWFACCSTRQPADRRRSAPAPLGSAPSSSWRCEVPQKDPVTVPPSQSDRGANPVTSARYGRVRDGVLTTGAALLARTARPLWYLESLVLSARYQQYLGSAPWASASTLHRDRLQLWELEAQPRLQRARATVFEFGVADGLATQWWAARGVPFEAWHGFDTFEGLPEAWGRAGVPVMDAGVFTPSAGKGSYPVVQAPYAFTWHTGLIEDTFPGMARPDTPLFVLIDVDLLEPTLVVLDWLAANGRPGDLVYFDEAFDPWNEGSAIRDAVSRGLGIRAIAHTGSSLLIELT